MSELSKLTIKVPIGLLEITATDEAIVGVKPANHGENVRLNLKNILLAKERILIFLWLMKAQIFKNRSGSNSNSFLTAKPEPMARLQK